MYNTPVANRLHIGIFGRRNAGKSSLINILTGQRLAIVSEIPGTTTDPVYKTMEILPIGPCMLIDTPGMDDEGALGEKRIEKARKVLRKTDVAVLVVDPEDGFREFEKNFVDLFLERKLPFVIVVNKSDIKDIAELMGEISEQYEHCLGVSSVTAAGIEELKKKIIGIAPSSWTPFPLVADIISKKDKILMVCPVDSAMPQGRLILPQVQVLREVLDSNAVAVVSKDSELKEALEGLENPPDLIITDSQVFETVKDIVPEDVPLTSFSIIFARHKGELDAFVEGVKAVEELEEGDEILIAEACTHHVQPEDIGRSKIPTWLQNITGKTLNFEVTAGGDFPDDLKRYKLIISCGGCMINRKEMLFRIEKAKREGVPITNYGIIIAYLSGILKRVLIPFSDTKILN